MCLQGFQGFSGLKGQKGEKGDAFAVGVKGERLSKILIGSVTMATTAHWIR